MPIRQRSSSQRRAWLAALALGMCALEARSAGADDPAVVEVEGVTYGGRASGRFQGPPGCAGGYPPAAAVSYVGFGARARYNSKGPRAGWAASVGAAIERNGYTPLDPGSAGETNVPSPHARGAANAEIGYDWRWFGFSGGVLAFQE